MRKRKYNRFKCLVIGVLFVMTSVSVYAKINERNNAAFTQPEIKAIRDRYSLNAEEINEIFFAN